MMKLLTAETYCKSEERTNVSTCQAHCLFFFLVTETLPKLINREIYLNKFYSKVIVKSQERKGKCEEKIDY